MAEPKLTLPRKSALTVLLLAERDGGPEKGQIVRYSNTTSYTKRTVYHQVADWLLQQGLAEWRDGLYSDLVLTDKGRERAVLLGRTITAMEGGR